MCIRDRVLAKSGAEIEFCGPKFPDKPMFKLQKSIVKNKPKRRRSIENRGEVPMSQLLKKRRVRRLSETKTM